MSGLRDVTGADSERMHVIRLESYIMPHTYQTNLFFKNMCWYFLKPNNRIFSLISFRSWSCSVWIPSSYEEGGHMHFDLRHSMLELTAWEKFSVRLTCTWRKTNNFIKIHFRPRGLLEIGCHFNSFTNHFHPCKYFLLVTSVKAHIRELVEVLLYLHRLCFLPQILVPLL